MELYHYTTWRGEQILKERVILCSLRYAHWAGETLLDDWPRLTFLTSDLSWDPSVQAITSHGKWEKCGSYPETYDALGIPCWKFEVNQNGLVLGYPFDFDGDDKWLQMLDDAVKLGSHIEDWRVVCQDVMVIKAWKWEDDEWNLKV